jgi:methionine biosynthesis protein MetW
VLDLGCGDGELLAHLQREGLQRLRHRDRRRQRAGLRAARRQRHPAQPGEGLALFDDASFDVVLQLDTLQHLRNTERMLRETARVGRIGIVSFPNFAHWPNRCACCAGRMPVTKALPYQWYDTPNIRVGTFADFEVLARKCGPARHRQLRPAGRAGGAALAQPAGQRGGVPLRCTAWVSTAAATRRWRAT